MLRKCAGKPGVLKLIVTLLVLLLPYFGTWAYAADTSDDYLRAVGNKLYDDAGSEVRLTGIAWFGFETTNQVYHGLWSVKMEDVLDTVANRGFNVVRIPLCVQLVNQWRNGSGGTPESVNYSANPDLQGLTSLQILDASIAYCKKIGLKVMLDMHRVVNTQMLDSWYTADYPASDFEACWKWLAEHYKNDDTVIAMDLFNEPHGAPGDVNMVKWDGSADQNNWKYEAERVANIVLDVNPRLLVVIEGIEATPKDGFTYAETNSANYDFNWWGGNLRRVKDYPVNLGSRQSQAVYSPHDYGPGVYVQPWFYSGFTQETLRADCWSPNWLYIATQNIAPILVGEWGGRMDGGDNEKWMGFLANEISEQKLNHTFWCVNPNSGDTGGILLDDWTTVDAVKYDLIKPTLWMDGSGKFVGLDHLVNLGDNGTHVGDATTPTGDVAATGVGVTPNQLALDSGATGQLTATVAPSDATNKSVTWKSSNTAVVSVSATGLVTVVAEGTANITVTTVDGGFTAICAVTVTGTGGGTVTTPCENPVAATLPLVIDGAGEYCRVTSGDISNINSWNMQLVKINGADYTNVWSDKMPAKIDGNYYIHYVGGYPWSHLEVNGSGGSSGTSTMVPVTGVTVTPASVTVNVGSTTTLTATVSPSNATNKSIAWSTSNTAVATVSSGGVVTGVSAGTAAITATTADGGYKAACAVTVSASSGSSDSTGTAGTLKVQMYNGTTTAQTNTINPKFKLVNTGTSAVDLSTVKIRYYYTIDGEKQQNFWCDWSPVGSANVTGTFVKLDSPVTGADYYLEVGFTSAAGSLAAGQSIEIQTRMAKSDWTNYTQTGDYSFNASATAYQDWENAPAYVSGTLQWGVDPAGSGGTVNYTLNITTSGNGTTTPAAGSHTYASGASVSVTATPASGATFSGWSGAATGTANPVTITMDADKTLTANFSDGGGTVNYTLNIATSGNGTTSPAPGVHTYTSGSSVSVTATPATGATFTGWSGAASGTENPVTLTMDANKSLMAIFSGGDDGLPDQCTGACNSATPVYPTILSDGGLGNVTMYSTAASDGGACNYGTTNVMYYAAMSVDVVPGDAQGQWQAGKICGQCAEVTALTSQGPKTVVVRIMDKCPDAYCGIDLGGSAPGVIMLDGFGRYTGKWRFVSCDGHPEVSDGSPTLDVLRGSNPWWSRVHVRNAPTATDSIEWKDANGETHGYFPFATDPENSFEVPVNDVLQSGMTSVLITVHYVDGSTATAALTPGQLATESASYPLD